jgi:ATP-dependent DNA ligase
MLSRRDPLPNFIKPQRSQLVDPPPAGPNWPHELKYDGYRIHARLAQGGAHLVNGNAAVIFEFLLLARRSKLQ